MAQTGADYVTDNVFTFQDANEDKNHNRGATEPAAIQPGMLFSDSDDEALYHRQASASVRVLQATDCMLYGLSLLSSTASVSLNTANKTTLYTVPAGKTCIITHVIVRNASTSITTAEYGFGFNANADDVITSATHTELTGATLFVSLIPKAGAIRGAAADVFGVKCTVNQGAAATVTISVFGYLF